MFFALSAQISKGAALDSFLAVSSRLQGASLGYAEDAGQRWQARHRLGGASQAARPQGCATAGVEGPTGTDWKALRFEGPEGSYGRRAGSG